MPHPVVSNPEIDTELVPFFNRPKNLNGLSGVAIMAVDREGQVIYSNAFGRRSLNAAEGEAMSTDTLCWIGEHNERTVHRHINMTISLMWMILYS